MRKLDLDILQKGLPGVTQRMSAFCLEAILVSMEIGGHSSGIILKVKGDFEEHFELIWTEKLDAFAKFSWQEETKRANFAAIGIGLLLAKELLTFDFFIESPLRTGVDFWLMKGNIETGEISDFERIGKIEISGINQETKTNTLNMRIGKKIKQMEKYKEYELKGWAIVVEFSKPKSKIVEI